MKILEQAVQSVRNGANRNQKARGDIAKQLERLSQDCAAATTVWKDFLARPANTGDQWSIVAWIGPARAKQLFDINLVARERLRVIADLAGGDAARLLTYEEDPIELAYRQLNPGESGIDAANLAVTRLSERIQLFDRLRAELGQATAKSVARAPGKRTKTSKVPKARATTRKPKTATKAKTGPKSKKKKAPAKK